MPRHSWPLGRANFFRAAIFARILTAIHNTFGPPWKLLAQLFGQLGRISKIGVVNIGVLRDNRFDPSADTISCLSLLDQIGRSNS